MSVMSFALRKFLKKKWKKLIPGTVNVMVPTVNKKIKSLAMFMHISD